MERSDSEHSRKSKQSIEDLSKSDSAFALKMLHYNNINKNKNKKAQTNSIEIETATAID